MRLPRALALAALLLPAVATAATQGQDLQFIACPAYRDTDAGRKSGCWLATSRVDGLRYDITRSPTKPDWNHGVLVEGRVAEGATDTCGGIVLDPVRVSVLPDACSRLMLPAQGAPGIRFGLPTRNVRPPHEAREIFVKGDSPKLIQVPFDYGNDFTIYQLADYYMQQATLFAMDTRPSRVEVIGYAATTPWVVAGRTLQEDPALAQLRADRVATWLRLTGVDPAIIEVRVGKEDMVVPMEGADGLREPSRRRVDVILHP
jgi:hypothetical protein